MPNDRQLAVLIWLAAAALLMLMDRDLRRSLGTLVRAAWTRKIAIVFAMMVLWVAGELLIARRLAWWDASMTTSTVFWFMGSGLVLFINAPESAEEEHFFRRSVFMAIKLSVLLGVFMNLFVLDLPAELLLQIALLLLFALSAVASHKDEFKQVKKLVDVVMAIMLLGLVAYEVTSIASDWNAIGHSGLAWQFFLPVWLTLGLLPFIYVAGVYSQYELAFLRFERTTGRRWALIASFGVQSHKLHAFVRSPACGLASSSTFTDARSAITQSLQDVRVEANIDD